MDYKDENKYHEHRSMLMGAIFMSNRKTKQECLKKKIFGLPLSKEAFISKIKAGMLLFLFENVERKLYGVFEATSDGALNIVPNAYISSGNSFPAQVLFKRIWMCKPLTEDEFGDAIKENYYTHNRFNFGLSYEQVCKLLYLFSSKKIRVNLPPGRGIPNNLIAEFEMSGGEKDQVTGEDTCLDFNSTEYGKVRGAVVRHSGPSNLNTNYPSYKKHFKSGCASLSSNERGSCQMPSLVIKPSSPFSMHPTFPDCPSDGGNFPPYISHDVNHQYFGSSADKIPSVTLGSKDNPPLSREPNTWTMPTMENRLPHVRSQIHPRKTNLNANHYCSSNYHLSSLPISKIPNVSLPSVEFEGHPNLQDCKNLTLPDQYDPSNPRIFFSTVSDRTTEGMGSLLPRRDPNSVEVVHGAQPLFDSSAPQLWGLGPSVEYIPLPGDGDGDFDRKPCHLDSPYGSYYSESEGDDSYELQPYPPTFTDEYYPTDTKSRLHSDTEKSRISVFSRLSKVSENRQKHASCERDSRDSLDQLMKLFSLRRDQILKANDYSTKSNNQEQPGSKIMMDSNMTAFLGDQVGSGSDTVDDDNTEVPFLNFKRRSKIRRTVGEDETGLYVMCDEKKELAGNSKRRKLVRPPLNEESDNLDGTSRDNLELGKQNKESENSIKMSEHKTSPPPEPSTSPETENVESAEINAGEDVIGLDKENKEGETNNTSSGIKSSPSPKTENVEPADKKAEGGVTGKDENTNCQSPKPASSPEAENVTVSSGNQVKEISYRTLHWFLEKRT